jgi:restriction endonuclease Mrr
VTDRGRELLTTKPAKIDKALLVERYPEIIDFIGGGRRQERSSAVPAAEATANLSPEEQLEAAHLALRTEIERTLLARPKSGSPEFFKRAVLDPLSRWNTAVPEPKPQSTSARVAMEASTGSSTRTGWASTRSTSKPSAGTARSGDRRSRPSQVASTPNTRKKGS